MIHEQLQDIFRRIFKTPELQINDDMTAQDVEAWDSLNHINLVLEVEKHFQIRFRNAEIARLRNVGDLKKLIDKHLVK